MRINIDAHWVIKEVRPSGLVVVARGVNFLTEAGEAYIADRLSDRDEGDGDISHWAIGTGTGQTRTDSTLATERERKALTVDQGTGSDDNDVEWSVTFNASEPATEYTFTEMGLFTALTSGTMISYMEIDPGVLKQTSMTWQLTLRWTIGAS